MRVATWLWKDVAPLLLAAEQAKAFSVTMEDLFNPAVRKDGKDPAPGTWPREDEVDTTKLVPGLILVGDSGIYLLTNVKNEEMVELKGPDGSVQKRRRLAYARECNPDVMDADDVWEAKRRIFGGDDGTIFLPATMFRSVRVELDKAGLGPEQGVIAASLTDNQIRLLPRKK